MCLKPLMCGVVVVVTICHHCYGSVPLTVCSNNHLVNQRKKLTMAQAPNCGRGSGGSDCGHVLACRYGGVW